MQNNVPMPSTAGGSRSLFWHRFTHRLIRDRSIRSLTAMVVMVGMLALMTVALGLGWVGARVTMLETAGHLAQHMGVVLEERMARTLEPAQATLREMARAPVVSATSLQQRLQYLPVMLEELAANPYVTSLYVGYRNGEFFMVRALDKPMVRRMFDAPRRANFLVQARTLGVDGEIRGSYHFFNADGLWIADRAEPQYTFDPRSRDWYRQADVSSAPVFTGPYPFFSTRQMGLTLSLVSHDGSAVVGVDWVLEDIGTVLSELRLSPDMRMALLTGQDEVLAHSDIRSLQVQRRDRIAYMHVSGLFDPVMQRLHEARPKQGVPVLIDIPGQAARVGFELPFDVWPQHPLRLLVTLPLSEVLNDLPDKYLRLLWWSLVVMGCTLAMGWWMGSHLGLRLEHLASMAHHIGLFNFFDSQPRPTYFKEFNHLHAVVSQMGLTIQSFLHLSRDMATEPEVDRMLDKVLHQLVLATRCEAGAVYLLDKDSQRLNLRAVDMKAIDPYTADSQWFADSLDPGKEASQWGSMAAHGLRGSRLELLGRSGLLQGVLVLVHVDDEDHADPAFVQFAKQLSGMLAVSIETRELNDAQKSLLDAVVRLMADAIDAKSPYTGGHCERVPVLATMLIEQMAADTSGPYADFHLNDDQRYAFHLGAWLHDCGKVTSPEHIVDKGTKLEVIYDRIHEIRTRFEVLWRDAEIDHLRRLLAGVDEATSVATLHQRQAQLQDDFVFVAHCNQGAEQMAQQAIQRLHAIASQTWLRHFDSRLGLSRGDAQRLNQAMQAEPSRLVLPAVEPLLADRLEHIVAWEGRKPPVERGHPDNRYGFDMVLPEHKQNMGEVYNLSVLRGTLTPEDRFQINDHIVQTYIMLRGLPWPEPLKLVPEIAATHHERMDGQGYPRKLPGSQLTLFDKVMAMADIFEALTAPDRPYKQPNSLSESLRIMANMCRNGHLDAEVLRYFLQSRLWARFAERFMLPSQIDGVDVAAIEAMLPPITFPATAASGSQNTADLPSPGR